MTGSQVTTFYSYKGGSGRSMALANVAWALATNNERVLVIDWDLEAPGLHRYFHPFLSDPDQKSSPGLIDRVWDYVDGLADPSSTRAGRFKLSNCSDIVQPLDIPGSSRGCLHFIGAGQQDASYSEKVVGLDWNGFYLKFDGSAFIDHLIEWARDNYTHILIDSRTGVADTAGICTAQIPDVLVMCLVYNRQSIDGTASVAKSIQAERAKRGSTDLRIEFVPSRVEDRSTVESARRYTTSKLSQVTRDDRMRVERNLRRAEIRHYPWCAFEEKLAVFEEFPDSKGSLLEAMHDLTKRVGKVDKKRFAIRSFEKGVLDSYWARAAFDDPRLLELETMLQDQRDGGWKSVYFWLMDATVSDDLRADWKMALAEAAVDFLTKGTMKIAGDEQVQVARMAYDIAIEAWHSDTEAYASRFALVLQGISAYHQQGGRLDDAATAISRAIDILEDDPTPTGRWRCGRALERQGDIASACREHPAALEAFSRALEIYMSIEVASQHFGAQFDLPRLHRLMAAEFMELGDLANANRSITIACQSLIKVPRSAVERDAVEALTILKARIRIAAELDDKEFARARQWVASVGTDMLSATVVRELDVELALASSGRLSRRGKIGQALDALRMVPGELMWRPELVARHAALLIGLDRTDEAITLLEFATNEMGTTLTPQVLDVARSAFEFSIDPDGFMKFLLSGMKAGVLPKDTLVWQLARNLADHDGETSKAERAKLFNLLDYIVRQRDE